MKSEHPKVATKLNGKPLIHYVIESLRKAGVQRICVIVGYKKEEVMQICSSFTGLEFVEQKEQLGTGHALLCAESLLKDFQGQLLVACGDTPLIHYTSFKNLLDTARKEEQFATVLSARIEKPDGYGRIIRNSDRELLAIIEHKDAKPEELKVDEINTGTYVFRSPEVFSTLKRVGTENAQGEYYLPDVIKIYVSESKKCGAVQLENAVESSGINSVQDLETIESLIKSRQVVV